MQQRQSDQPNKNMSERLTPEQRDWVQLAIDDAASIAILQAKCDILRAQLEELRIEKRVSGWPTRTRSDESWHRKTAALETDNAALRAQLEAAQKELERMSSKAEAFDGGRTQYFDALLSIREAVTGEPDNKPRVPDTLARIAALRARCEQLQRENEALVNASSDSPTR